MDDETNTHTHDGDINDGDDDGEDGGDDGDDGDDGGDDGDDDDYLHGRWTVFPTLVVRLPTD